MDAHYRKNAKPLPQPPKTKWELYVKSYGMRRGHTPAYLTAVNVGPVLIGCVIRICIRPESIVVAVNATIGAVFILLWVAAFVRVRKVLAPSESAQDPEAS